MTKPCEMTCPKCGSTDICRQWRGAESRVHPPNTPARVVTTTLWPRLANELIRHHCRVCHYEWDTDTLNEQGGND